MEQRREAEEMVTPDEPTLEDELASVMAELRQPVPPAEIARRRRLVAKTLRLREAIGPIRVSVAELVRELRDGERRDD